MALTIPETCMHWTSTVFIMNKTTIMEYYKMVALGVVLILVLMIMIGTWRRTLPPPMSPELSPQDKVRDIITNIQTVTKDDYPRWRQMMERQRSKYGRLLHYTPDI